MVSETLGACYTYTSELSRAEDPHSLERGLEHSVTLFYSGRGLYSEEARSRQLSVCVPPERRSKSCRRDPRIAGYRPEAFNPLDLVLKAHIEGAIIFNRAERRKHPSNNVMSEAPTGKRRLKNSLHTYHIVPDIANPPS